MTDEERAETTAIRIEMEKISAGLERLRTTALDFLHSMQDRVNALEKRIQDVESNPILRAGQAKRPD